MTDRPRIALISATTAAIAPAVAALAAEFPDAEAWNILDDRLLRDAEARGGVDEELVQRMRRLIGHALSWEVDGVLLTCSQYGAIADTVEAPVPVLPPDGPVFDELIAVAPDCIVVVASLESACVDSVARLTSALSAAGVGTDVVGVVADGAFAPAQRGDVPQMAAEIAAAVGDRDGAVLLAQYSLAPAAEALAARLGRPVYAGPISAARRLAAASHRSTSASPGSTPDDR